ncbi:putative PEP-CTERM system TPR-repeat lipoprotein [Nitrosomonas sp. Nm51]|uniref:XrtA/PEP-CTERM system TPR-repeat protein PrsT n=1 Tax=Nitrosomonas sp. Nm51 TaxID=133720 RepID=UPI0008BD1A38|nr:XrtA/PEP-CTERM system TPR-repeat protein PrsT [Nitrosomonas sp. Nm51]SER15947.1 putative PEP-CTERM system TPR-repeat lipoprotein [Nitrosomonas sp. Nm51]
MHDFFFCIQKKHWLNNIKSALVCALIILGLTACGETKDAETLIAEATEYQKKGDVNAAIIQFKNAIRQEPNNAKARFLLGAIYQQRNDPLSAEKELSRALELGMDAQRVLPVLYQVLFDLGKFQQLLDTIEQNPQVSSHEIQILHGNTLLALMRNQEAKIIFDRLLAENPDSPDALIGLAQYALSEKDLALASQYADQAVEKNPESLTAWRFKANLLRAQNKFDEALKAFDQVIQLSPDNATAYYDKASIEIGLGRFDDAENSIALAREIAPDSILLHQTQAFLDFNQREYAKALNSIQTVLSAAPEHLPSVLLAGAIQLSLGSFIQAEQYLEQYLKNIPGNLYARKLMIDALLKNNKTQQAIEYLEPALPVAQEDPQLLALAGETYMRAGNFTKATEFYEKANALVPDNAMLHTALGMTRLAMGDREQGIAELELATDLDKGSPRAGILLILMHFRANEFDKALAEIDELVQSDPQNPLYHNLKGVAYMGKEDFVKASENFNKALAIQPDFFPAISNLARLDMRDQKPEAAQNRFKAILKKDDNNIQAMNALAALALSRGDVKEATHWLELSSNKNPDALEPALRLAAHYLNQDEQEKALLLSRKLYGSRPNEPRVLELLGQVQLAQKNYTAALDSYEKLAAQLPDSAAAQFKIAEINAARKDYAAAESALKKALFINPDYIQAKVAQAKLAMLEDNDNKAISIARKIQKEHADIPVGYEIEGDLLLQQKKPELALAAYEKAFAAKQTSLLAIKIHTALNHAGNEKKAHAHISQWVSDNPDDNAARLYLANVYLNKKQYNEATKEYEAILKNNPRQITSLNNLAWLYHQSNDPRALDIAQKAYEMAPESPAIADTFGWILAQKGELERALELLENAASKQPDNATIQYHYAHTLVKAGNQNEARQILNEITSSDAAFPEISEARELLEQIK